MGEQEVRWEKTGIESAGDYIFFNRYGNQGTEQDSAYIYKGIILTRGQILLMKEYYNSERSLV
jgi:hypothetical protein